MILRKIFAGALACAAVYAADAQSVSFINTPSDGRNAAMGDAGYVMLAGALATRYNTAGMLFSGDRAAVGASLLNWQPDAFGVQVWAVGGYYTINDRVGLAAGIRLDTHDSYMRTDENGNDLGDFTPKEQAFDLGVAYKLVDRLAVSATLRYIGSDMGGPEKGAAFAADLHAFYGFDRLRLGLGITNLGSKIDYGYSKTGLPSRLKLGASYDLLSASVHALTGSAEINYQLAPEDYTGVTMGLGAEYTYDNLFSLRGGYYISDKDITGDSYGSVGCGVNVWKMSLDFAYLVAGSDSFMKNTLLISLGCRFR